MINEKGARKCDACGKTIRMADLSMPPRGMIGAEKWVRDKLQIAESFHANFDFCPDSQRCFANAALKAAQDYKKNFDL